MSRFVQVMGPAVPRLFPALATALCTTSATSAQTPPPPSAGGGVDYGVSADTIGFGDRFELGITLRVPAGQTAYLPSLIRGDESFEGLPEAGSLVEPLTGGGRSVTVRYSLIAYRVGLLTIPAIELSFGQPPAGSSDVAVAFYDPSVGPPSTASASTGSVPKQEVWVNPVLLVDDITEGLAPRPADDVVGPSWHARAIFSGVAFGSLLLGVLFVSGKDWLEARRGGESGVAEPLDPIATARERALEELDRLLVSNLPTSEVTVFYARTSSAVRRYVEHFDGAWGPAHTSTELMGSLEERRDPSAPHSLIAEMRIAEVVKFGRLRPDLDSAQQHCRALRAWVAST